MCFRLFLLLLIGTTSTFAAPNPAMTSRRSVYSIGLAAQILFPDRLPDFRTSIPTYGLVASMPVGNHSIQLQGNFGTSNELTVYLFESNFRFHIDTPFVDYFLFAGIHYLYFDYLQDTHWRFGANAGPGIRLKLGENLDGQVILKLYLQDKTILAFGGGLTFLL